MAERRVFLSHGGRSTSGKERREMRAPMKPTSTVSVFLGRNGGKSI